MADVRVCVRRVALCALVMSALACFALGRFAAQAQSPPSQAQGNPPTTADMVVDVRIVGNQAVKLQRISPMIRTRAGRNFDPQVIEDDVRKLNKSRMFVSVNTSYRRTPEGVVVIFQIVERPTLRYVRYPGGTLMRSTLDKQSGIKVGDAIDPYLVDDARRKLEEYYKSKGFSKVRVLVSEGNKPGDRGAVFLIHEGPKQKIWDIEFEGNTIATDDRLKTQISSKTPILYVFRGEIDEQKLDEDIEKLTAYYRSLGFFSAKIGRELEFDENGAWATLRFIINEGPRYKVRNVSIVGARKFPTAELEQKLKLTANNFFDQGTMQRDVTALQDRYGTKGYVYCTVQPDIQFQLAAGELDLVYQLEEGARYRVARVDVHIDGDDSHTRMNTVLNRIELRPGDIVDIRKIRDSERRLAASSLFMNNPAQGTVPKITYSVPDDAPIVAERNAPTPTTGDDRFRGQSPDAVVFRGQSPDDYVLSDVATAEFDFQPQNPDDGVGEVVEQPNFEPYNFAVHCTVTSEVRFNPATGTVERFEIKPTVTEARVAAPPEGFGNPFTRQHADSGNPFAAQRPRQFPEDAAPQQSFEPPAPVAQPAPAEAFTVRFQSPDPSSGNTSFGGAPGGYGQVPSRATSPDSYVRPAGGFSPGPSSSGGQVTPTQYTPPPGTVPGPNFGDTVPSPYAGGTPAYGGAPAYGSPGAGVPGTLPGYGSGGDLTGQPPVISPYEEPTNPLDLRANVAETQTGRFMLGVGVNSNAGLLGSIVLDEQNADITRLPYSWRDFIDGKAFRGAGQQVRIEAVPGTQVSRYSFIFRQPYLFDTRVQFGLSGYYFQRFYRDWQEQRLGGRIQLGYQFPYVPDLSVSSALRIEQVDIKNPSVPTPPQLQRVLGTSFLGVAEFAITHDTRDNLFLATQGHRIVLGYDQGFGDFTFPRGTVEARQHFLLHERPDRSGRHVMTLMTQLGFAGHAMPLYENYFAGGFSSMRGFNFRGVGPYVGQVNVGGVFQWLNTAEYMFPISADDMVRGVVFCDYGTVEDDIAVRGRNFRVSPGFGLRLTIPAMGPAPIALDFAVPVIHGPNDNIQNFAFYVGFGR